MQCAPSVLRAGKEEVVTQSSLSPFKLKHVKGGGLGMAGRGDQILNFILPPRPCVAYSALMFDWQTFSTPSSPIQSLQCVKMGICVRFEGIF